MVSSRSLLRLDLWRRRATWRLLAPAAVAFVLAALAMAFVLISAADNLDRVQREDNLRAVNAIVDHALEDLLTTAGDYSNWDESYLQITAPEIDQAWADENIGAYVTEQFGFTDVIVLNGENKFVFVHEADEEDGGELPAYVGTPDATLLRLAETVRSADEVPGPRTASGFVKIAGELHFAAAGLVFPVDTSLVTPERGVSHVIIMMCDIDSPLFMNLKDDFGISGFRYEPDVAPHHGSHISVTLTTGVPAGYLVWDEPSPGNHMVAATWPGLLGVFFVLGFFVLATVHGSAALSDRLRASIVRAAEAQAASREKDKFLAVMSHELRTPLNAVIGFSEIMSGELLGQHCVPEYKQYAADIASSGKHLLAIVDDILLAAKLQSGDYKIASQSLDAEETVHATVHQLHKTAKAAQVRILFEAPERPIAFAGDQRAVERVLRSVLANAIKFSPAGAAVEVSARARGREVVIVIEDRGAGIPADHLAALGQPFQQVESAFARQHGGAGLGLAISRGLMDLMGGAIGIESEEGKGTRVTLRLPLAKPGIATQAA